MRHWLSWMGLWCITTWKMHPKDEETTTFHSLKGVSCYKVMHFDIKKNPRNYHESLPTKKSLRTLRTNCPEDATHFPEEQWRNALEYQIISHKTPSHSQPNKRTTPHIIHYGYDQSFGALFAQENAENKENALYYLTWILVKPEERYWLIEKVCLALIFSIKKLRHYLQHNSTKFISKEERLKYIMSRRL